ncbi:MAG: (deoxy)nucleoside triphosphate pyrophosphohydrolase [Candidatus Nanosyncoccaceae bacterium]
MKKIEVVAAVIRKNDKILSTERGYGELEGFWEFPGGKIEPGENKEQALKREIMEEMNVEIEVEDYITTVEYDYPTFHLIMHSFICELDGDFELLEHHAAKWLTRNELDDVKWCPADVEIVEKIKEKPLI